MENNQKQVVKVRIFTIKNIISFIVIVFIAAIFLNKYNKLLNEKRFYEIQTKITNSADLISQRMTYRGIYTYKAGLDIRIPYITERSHNLIYTAILTAGIDLEKDLKLINEEDSIIVELKHAYIIDKYLEPNSLEVYDIRGSLIYYDKEKDVIESQKAVEENLEDIINSDSGSNATVKEFLDGADNKIKEIITALVSDLLGNKKLVFKYTDGGE